MIQDMNNDLFAGIENQISSLKDPRPQVQQGSEEGADATTHLQNAEHFLLENEKTQQMFASRLSKARNISAEIGKIAGDIMHETFNANKMMNYAPSPSIVIDTANHIVNMVTNFAEAIGAYQAGKQDADIQAKALRYALIRIIEKDPDALPPEYIEKIAGDIEGGRYDGAMNKPTGMLKPGEVPQRNVPVPPQQEEPMPPEGGGGGMPPMMPPMGGQ